MFGKITYWNQPRGFGFVTVNSIIDGAVVQNQYFFHYKNFTKDATPVLGAWVMFELGEPHAVGKKIQAVGVRFAAAEEIKSNLVSSGIGALKAAIQ